MCPPRPSLALTGSLCPQCRGHCTAAHPDPGHLCSARPWPVDLSGRLMLCGSGHRFGGDGKPQAGLEGEWVTSRFLSFPISKGGAAPEHQRGGMNHPPPGWALAPRTKENHFNRPCSFFSLKECFECAEFWNIQPPPGRHSSAPCSSPPPLALAGGGKGGRTSKPLPPGPQV